MEIFQIKDAIISIVNEMDSLAEFDTHHIINKLINNYNEIYTNTKTPRQNDGQYHAWIARTIINKMDLIKLCKVYSININGRQSRNQLWRKP